MKEYVKPLIIDNSEMMESVYASEPLSGSGQEKKYSAAWEHHNSGHHSVLYFYIDVYTDYSVESCTFKFKINSTEKMFVKCKGMEEGKAKGENDNQKVIYLGNNEFAVTVTGHQNAGDKYYVKVQEMLFTNSPLQDDETKNNGGGAFELSGSNNPAPVTVYDIEMF